jgi:LPS sulfotransferase NodH
LRDLSLGNPEEYLAAAAPSYYLPRWGLPPTTPYPAYLAEALRRATHPGGVLGVKAHWYQMRYCLDRLGGAPWESAKYIHLRREDTLRQAISWWRALVSGQWWRVEGMAAPTLDSLAVPDRELQRIAELRAVLEEHDRAWTAFFTAQGAVPLVLTYERVVADYAAAMRAAAAFIGVSAAPASPPATVRQADAATDVLAHRLIGYLRSVGGARPGPTVTPAGPGSAQGGRGGASTAWWEV